MISIPTDQGPLQIDVGETELTNNVLDNITRDLKKNGYTFESPIEDTQELDFANASLAEIDEYARQQRAKGIDPYTGKQISEEEFIRTYKAPGVDYGTGVSSNDVFSRYMFGRADTAEDKKLYLNKSLGKEGYYQDALGRFIANQKGREKMGMGEGADIALDEEGVSWNDLKDFAGESGTEILAGTGAALMASGYGFVPGVIISSLAAGGAKILDEKIDEAQGIQAQTKSEVLNDALFTTGSWAIGEGVGRGFSALIGRIIKGPTGAGIAGVFGGGKAGLAQTEATRAAYRAAIEKGYAPTIAGIDPTFRPILGRLQAVYEGVFPNKAAAQRNLTSVLEDLKKSGLAGKNQIKDLDLLVRADIDKYYSTSTQKLANATMKMDKAVLSELDKMLAKLKKGDKFVPKELNKYIFDRKKVFDEDMNELYRMVDEGLEGQAIIPVQGIIAELDTLTTNSIADIGATRFATKIKELGAKNGGYATHKELGVIRTGLMDASKSPGLIADANVSSLAGLKKSIDRAFEQAEVNLAQFVKTPDDIMRSNLLGSAAFKREQASKNRFWTDDKGVRRGTKKMLNNSRQLADSLNLLTRTRSLYSKGIKRFDNFTVQSIIKGAAKNRLNYKHIFDEIILKDDSAGLTELLQAIKGVSTQRTLGSAGILRTDRFNDIYRKIPYGAGTLEDGIKAARNMDPNSPTFKKIERLANEAVREAKRMSTITGTSTELVREVREGLAKMYLQKAIKDSIGIDFSTGVRRVDALALAANIREKGSVVDKLFGKGASRVDGGEDLSKPLNGILEVLERNKGTIAPEIMDQLDQLPLGSALREFQVAQAARKEVDKNTVLKVLNSTNNPDVIAQTVFQNANAVREANQFLSASMMDKVRDASMSKILRQIGAATDDQGQIRLSDNFIEAFQSGRLGRKLQTVLGGYKDETLDAMFGKQTTKGLHSLADRMVQVSDASLAGKGGLAAPNIALGFTLGNFLLGGSFFQLLGTAAGMSFMAKALRHPGVLKMMMAPRSKLRIADILKGKVVSGDPFGQGAQAFMQLLSQAAGQAGIEGVQTAEKTAAAVAKVNKPAVQEAIRQLPETIKAGMSNLMPSVEPPNEESSVSNISPIVLPNPNDQVLAERLNNTRSA